MMRKLLPLIRDVSLFCHQLKHMNLSHWSMEEPVENALTTPTQQHNAR